MSKPSKLTEKATRIPETRELQWNQVIPQYLQEVEPLHSESSRSHRFAALLQELLGLSEPGFIESYSSGIEKSLKVRQKDRILKGRADNLFGNLLIEFEANIPKTQKEAEEQLRRYTAILWSQEGDASRTPYICLATDGVRFIAYSPVLTETPSADIAPDDISLQVIESVDWTTLEPREVYYWLDRYFLRKELLRPSSEALVRDFGISSHALQMTELDLLSLWKQIKTHSAFNVVYDSWEKYLRIVYGSSIAGDELFIRHTYLATLAKLMAWMRITGKRSLPNEPEIVEILEGRVFKAQGIENFIEEDFFSWIAREDASETGIIVTRKLFSLLQNYNLSELSEDVLKSLYQELVDPETRHDLGEFYTPDWLAHRIVNKLLDEKPEGSFLDPACGSGTFLYLTIKEKRQRLGDSAKTLSHILESVKGADIHPLAIITAKTNYILALGELFRTARRGTVTIPIYLADTLRPPERWTKQALVDYEVSIEDQPVYLPEPLLQNPDLYDQAIELAKEYARQNKGKAITLEAFQNYLTAQGFAQSENELTTKIFAIAETLKHFIDIDRDTIWAFVLKNIFKPLFFKDSFDFIIGNPPWISFRYMDTDYQKFLRVQITKGYMLLRGRGELITHLEIATLFLVRAADLYLKSGGTVAFVLPRSIFTGDQHHDLRQRTFIFTENPLQNLFFKEVWDCEKVKPLFGVPSCVVIADKRATDKMAYPIPEESLGGRLDRKNASLEEAEKLLTINSAEISLNIAGKRSYWTTGEAMIAQEASCYKKRFMQGATIVPRSFWFVQTPPSPLGFNPGLPLLETSDHARKEAKADYKTVYLKGNVESRFLLCHPAFRRSPSLWTSGLSTGCPSY